jgi:hypothetical protein
METAQVCPECGAVWRDGKTCQDSFHQMLAWEYETPALWEVHHLTVLCYHLQHPILYSPEGLEYSKQLLVDFAEHRVTPEEMRRRNRTKVDSGNRKWKIAGTPDSHGVYNPHVKWSLTALDVVDAGMESYRESVRAWAASTLADLRTSGNLQQQP